MIRKHISRRQDKQTPFMWIAVVMLVLLLSGFSLNGGPFQDSATTGTEIWIEFPFNGIDLPNQTITFVIYATAADGVGGIELKVNGQSLPAGQMTSLSSDGGNLMMRLDQEWQPPAEGEYTLEAFASGASSSVTFCVVTCQPEGEIEIGPTGTTTATLPVITLPPNELTYTPTATLFPEQPSGEVSIEFFASPSSVDAGSCTTLHWDVVGSENVSLNGTPVYFRGMEERCPCETESHNLQVVKSDGSTVEEWVTIEAYGSCSEPPAEPTPTDTPPPPSDTTGPSFNSGYLIWEDCKFYGVSDVSDPSGVSWAKFGYNLNGQGWQWLWMSDTGYGWQSDAGISVMDGIGTPIGDIEFQFQAADSLNNENYSGSYYHSYTSCDG